MSSQNYLDSPVGDIVAHDLRTAAVLARHNIDFCCGGRRTLAAACAAGGVQAADVAAELADLQGGSADAEDTTAWSLPRLVGYIVTQHHEYVRANAPVIAGWLARLVDRHGPAHAEVAEIAAVFSMLRTELDHHMLKEERVLFPRILSGAAADVVAAPIAIMEDEHEEAAQALERLRTLTDGYTPPPYGCATWRATYAALGAFDADLRRHVHLENNVLFPAALRLSR